MTTLLIFGSVLVVSAISLVGVLLLSLKAAQVQRISMFLIALAAGALLGDAFLHLIPEAFEEAADSRIVALAVLGGIVIVMLFERFLWWHHDHHERDSLEVHDAEGRDTAAKEHARIEPVGRIVLLSDGLHNFLDGVGIAASFLVSTEIGVATMLAIVFHEIPQEIGDFGVLLHSGYSRGKALMMNVFSALSAVGGAGLVLLLGTVTEDFLHLLLPIAAGSFIYIALTDLIPELHRRRGDSRFVAELFTMIAGIGLMYALLFVEA
jgi:zinc and cadmium transporter